MRTEHMALRRVGALSIRESEFSQANMLETLTAHQDRLALDMQDKIHEIMQTN